MLLTEQNLIKEAYLKIKHGIIKEGGKPDDTKELREKLLRRGEFLAKEYEEVYTTILTYRNNYMSDVDGISKKYVITVIDKVLSKLKRQQKPYLYKAEYYEPIYDNLYNSLSKEEKSSIRNDLSDTLKLLDKILIQFDLEN